MKPRRSFAHVQRPVGVRGIKFRSKMEANYAAYLEWLIKVGEIQAWEYEFCTYWFTPDKVNKGGVRRGVTSYKPDFFVIPKRREGELNRHELHEVKGYLDPRSKTALTRMKRYYPEERMVVIDSAAMKALRRQVGGIVPDWIP